MGMTHRERMLAAIRKEPADQLPYSIRMDQWYNWHVMHGTLPDEYRDRNPCDIIRSLGGALQWRRRLLDVGHRTREERESREIWQEDYKGVEVRVTRQSLSGGREQILTEYVTPVGTVSRREEFNPEGSETFFETDKLFKSEGDYPALEYLFANTEVTPSYDFYVKMVEDVGEDGLEVANLGYCPTHLLMQTYMGYDKFYYELQDHPDKVEHLLGIVTDLERKKLQIAADSPSEVIMIGGNWSDSIHVPVWRKYMVPWFREASEFLHQKGKFAYAHIDGEMKRLIPMFLETGIDVAEAFTPQPMTSVTTEEVREAWGDKVTLWGGIPSVMFEPNYTDQEFDDFVMNLFRDIKPGYNFIVGMGDNVPFNAVFHRVKRVAELVEKYGKLPISV